MDEFDFDLTLAHSQLAVVSGCKPDPHASAVFGDLATRIAIESMPEGEMPQLPAILIEFLIQLILTLAVNYATECIEKHLRRSRHNPVHMIFLTHKISTLMPEGTDKAKLAWAAVKCSRDALDTPEWAKFQAFNGGRPS